MCEIYDIRKAVTIAVIFSVFSVGFVSAQNNDRKKGKWNGDFGMNAGTNFNTNLVDQRTHHMGSGTAAMSYSTSKYAVSVNLNGSYDYHFTGIIGVDTNMAGTDTTRVVDSSANESENLALGGGISATWSPDIFNKFSVSYSYAVDRNTPNNYTISDGELSVDQFLSSSFSRKESQNDINTHKALISYERSFAKPGRKLNAEISFSNVNNSTYAEWLTGKGNVDLSVPIAVDEGYFIKNANSQLESHYRDTPSQRVTELNLAVKYVDRDFCNVKNLNLDFILLANVKGLEDHRSAATYVDGQWKDSVEVRENFLYRTISLAPSIHATYKKEWFILDWTFTPEAFLQRLDSDGKSGDISRGEIAQNASLKNTFKTKKGNELFFNASRSESRPSYLQICWFPRQSVLYSDEIYVGNPDLNNTVKTKLNGGINLSTNTPFSLSTSATYSHTSGKIQETYSYQIINEKEYRVYTWVNGGTSDEFTASMKLLWKAEKFNASLLADYNVYHGVNLSGDVTNSGDYSLRVEAGYKLNTWAFAADITYQSDIVRDYSTVKNIAECNVRVSKTFGRLMVTLDGNNLLDRPISWSTKSDDLTEIRQEVTKNYKRIFVLGLTYSF